MGFDLIGGHVDHRAESFVRHRAVVTLEEVVHHGFPVGLDAVGQTRGKGEVGQVGGIPHDFTGQCAALLRQRGRLRVEIDEHEVAKHFDLHGVEANVLALEILDMFRARRVYQAAVEVVGPGMIGAGDAFGLTFTEQQLVTAMFADVVVGAQVAVTIAYRDDALSFDTQGHVTAGSSQFFLVTDELPAAMENLFAFDLQETRIEVATRIDRMGTNRGAVVAALEVGKFRWGETGSGHGDSPGWDARYSICCG